MTRQSPGGRAAFADPGVGGENGSMDPAPRVPLTPGRCRDVVLLGSTGSIGTQAADIIRRNPDRFRLTALAAGRVLALANKESLIMGGKLVIDRAAPGQIVPVDSEHSAIAQCLRS